jgi:hypothetical protein
MVLSRECTIELAAERPEKRKLLAFSGKADSVIHVYLQTDC